MARSVEAQINAAMKKVNDRAATLTKIVALEVFKRVVARTPVDTGRARANWQLGVGTRPAGVLDSTTPPAAPTQALAALNVKLDKVYITNNVPYIEYLENGSSTQAPNGMVAVTVAEMQVIAPGLVRKVSR